MSDLYLAAFLLTKGMRFLRIERLSERDRKNRFIFEDRLDREDMVRAFVAEGLVKVKDFRHALDDLKALIHNW